jgi:exodeoxyribonuclease-1
LPENAERLGLDKQICLTNLELLKSNTNLFDVVQEVFQQERSFDNKGNVDAMLYDRFFSYEDKRDFEKIRNASAEDLATLKFFVSDDRFNDLFFRYKARNFSQLLTDDEHQKWERYCRSVFELIKDEYFENLNLYFEQHKNNEQNIKILKSLSHYAQDITDRYC